MLPVPKVTQPGWIRYESWLEDNDDILASMTNSFVEQLYDDLQTKNFDRAKVIDMFLKFVYNNSSSASRAWKITNTNPAPHSRFH